MTLSEELTWRGFVQHTTLNNLNELDQKQWVFYHGFDASSDSQTVGNLAAMMLDRLFLRYGHKAILLAGGATSLIGDPGGKDKEREIQDGKTIAHNIGRAEDQLKNVLSGYKYKLVNNLDWNKDIKLLPFLREVGKHFSMTPLVQRDYIAQRIGKEGTGISYAEFSYTILQGYDYLHLFDKFGCTLQLGGSDQWGNCLSGVELIRKTRGAEAHAITLPLIINKLTGKKFGKSEEGAIWLDEKKTSVYKFYQFWLNADDESAEDYLKIFTELEKGEIERILEAHNQEKASRHAQTRLAHEVTKLVHGPQAAAFAQVVTDYLTGAKPIAEADEAVLNEVRSEISAIVTTENGSIIEALTYSGLAVSHTEARRLLSGNAVSVNSIKISREQFEAGDFQNGRLMLRKGKKYKDSALVELS